MTNRIRARRRRTWRLVLFSSLLIVLVSVEAITMSAIYRRATCLPTHPEVTLDPAVCFQFR